MHYKPQPWIIFIPMLLVITIGCKESSQIANEHNKTQETAIKNIHLAYVDGWKKMDKVKVMDLIDENAIIQPNTLTPISSKSKIESFWFPDDSSVTKINSFDTDIIFLQFMDTLAVTTHKSRLDWDYKKGTTEIGMVQEGINTTLYRLQSDSTWKIWRSMWTDYNIQQKQ